MLLSNDSKKPAWLGWAIGLAELGLGLFFHLWPLDVILFASNFLSGTGCSLKCLIHPFPPLEACAVSQKLLNFWITQAWRHVKYHLKPLHSRGNSAPNLRTTKTEPGSKGAGFGKISVWEPLHEPHLAKAAISLHLCQLSNQNNCYVTLQRNRLEEQAAYMAFYSTDEASLSELKHIHFNSFLG